MMITKHYGWTTRQNAHTVTILIHFLFVFVFQSFFTFSSVLILKYYCFGGCMQLNVIFRLTTIVSVANVRAQSGIRYEPVRYTDTSLGAWKAYHTATSFMR